MKRSNIPFIRFGLSRHCTYCGERPECQDHVIPVSSYRTKRTHRDNRLGLLTFSCNRCNQILGANVFSTFQKRVEFVTQELDRRVSKLKAKTKWPTHEITALSGELKSRVITLQRKLDEASRHQSWVFSEEFRRIINQFSKLDLVDSSSPNYLEWLDSYLQFDLTAFDS